MLWLKRRSTRHQKKLWKQKNLLNSLDHVEASVASTKDELVQAIARSLHTEKHLHATVVGLKMQVADYRRQTSSS